MASTFAVMPEFTHITDLLKRGQMALCISTRGERLQIGQTGHGSTGHWRIDPAKQVELLAAQSQESQRPITLSKIIEISLHKPAAWDHRQCH